MPEQSSLTTKDRAWPLAVVIICKDERATIERAVASARRAVEIVVVDSGSTDGTREWLATAPGLKVFDRPFDDFAQQKNFAVASASVPWVLVLDADEWIEADLGAELARFDPGRPEMAFAIRRVNWFMGRKIRFAYGRERLPRLFHRERARYGASRVHEGLVGEGAVGRIEGVIGHDPYTARGLSAHLIKADRYTTLAALDRWPKSGPIGPWQLIIKPLFGFLKRYVLRLGFLDGLPGLFIAASGAWNVFIRSVKIARLQAGERFSQEGPPPLQAERALGASSE